VCGVGLLLTVALGEPLPKGISWRYKDGDSHGEKNRPLALDAGEFIPPGDRGNTVSGPHIKLPSLNEVRLG
jgi:hypothetical protein